MALCNPTELIIISKLGLCEMTAFCYPYGINQ